MWVRIRLSLSDASFVLHRHIIVSFWGMVLIHVALMFYHALTQEYATQEQVT